MSETADLVGYWPMKDDLLDHSGNGLASDARDVKLSGCPDGRRGCAGRFNGASSVIEVRNHPSLNFGTGDFTIATWIYTESTCDVVGDIVGKFEGDDRSGFNFAVVSNAGVTSTQSNYRNVHFGIDNGRSDSNWVNCGRPGNAAQVSGLAVWQGYLYAGTFEMGETGLGHVWKYLGESRWLDMGAPDGCNNVYSLAVHDGKLYCGSNYYRPRDSALPPIPPPNETPGGRVFRFDGPDEWADCGRPGTEGDGINTLVVFRGRLYAAHQKHRGVFVYEGAQEWRCVGMKDSRVISLSVYRGELLTNANGPDVYKYEGGEDWSRIGSLSRSTQNYGMAIHRGELYVSTWPQGYVYRFLGGDAWVPACGAPGIGYQKEIMALNIYNGKLYCGTLPNSDVFRYERGTQWVHTGRLDPAPDVPIRRTWSMCVHRGRLYAGTLPGGHVCSYEAGKMASVDDPLPGGWHHVAAVRRGGYLSIYMDGEEVSRSTQFRSSDLDISCSCPMTIGFGAHEYLDGMMSDLRIHSRALGQDEIAKFAATDS